ncbi:SAF domain-containing protein [Raineyella fluvialis]|nr:SAF domain-containing protein [Raineyella fluvialis]
MRRRQPRWILAGVLAMVIGALGSVALWTQLADTSSVLRLNRTVYRGDVIRAQDLSPVTVGRLNGLDVVPADAMGTVVGKPARTDIAEGGLLTRASVGREDLPAGRAIVGLRLPEGRVPRIPLEPGTPVLLVEATPDQSGAAAATRAFRAEINRAVESSYDQVATLVDVSVARRDAEDVARLAAAGRIILVRGS